MIVSSKKILSSDVMGIEAISDDGVDFFDQGDLCEYRSTLWNGRHIEQITEKDLITQFYIDALRQIEEKLNRPIDGHTYDLLDLSEEVEEELSVNFDYYVESAYQFALHHPMNRDFALIDPANYELDIIRCGNVFKSTVKSLKKCSKKAIKGIKRGAKEVNHFVKEHKKEILIAAAVIAVAAGAYIVAGALTGTAAGADEGSRGAGRKREDDDDPTPPPVDPLPKDNLSLLAFAPLEQSKFMDNEIPSSGAMLPVPNKPAPEKSSFRTAFENFVESVGRVPGLYHPGSELFCGRQPDYDSFDFSSPKEPLSNNPEHDTPSVRSAISTFMESIGNGLKSSIANKKNISLERFNPREVSSYVQLEGNQQPGKKIGFINGMATSYDECKNHMEHIQKFTNGLNIEGVYNHSNNKVFDFFEIFALNYSGFAPVTGDLLLENWKKFHEENKNDPEAKYLQFTHSMGTILTKNALAKAPEEIRDRVIVVAIGPAVVIPEGLCHKAFHYASKNDPVHFGENIYQLFTSSRYDESEQLEFKRECFEGKERLVLVEPHPGVVGWDHDFESPTFEEKIERHVKNYLNKNGSYR